MRLLVGDYWQRPGAVLGTVIDSTRDERDWALCSASKVGLGTSTRGQALRDSGGQCHTVGETSSLP